MHKMQHTNMFTFSSCEMITCAIVSLRPFVHAMPCHMHQQPCSHPQGPLQRRHFFWCVDTQQVHHMALSMLLQCTDQSSTVTEQAQTSQYVKEQPSGEQQKSAPSQQAALDQQQQQVPHISSLIAADLMSRSGSGTSDKALPQRRMADPDFAALMTNTRNCRSICRHCRQPSCGRFLACQQQIAN